LEHDSALAAKLRSEGIENFIDKWMDQPIIRSQQGEGAEVRIARKKQLLAEPLAASLKYFSNGRLMPVDEEFSKIARKITLIAGEQDHKFGAIHRALADQHANVVCLKVPETGHAPNIENPQMFSETVEELLD
ncbi:MAG: hypothetical protein MI748_05680, partial [Opitutales bacterium]|nr:hypothetical protein [Opitutales bacterium]